MSDADLQATLLAAKGAAQIALDAAWHLIATCHGGRPGTSWAQKDEPMHQLLARTTAVMTVLFIFTISSIYFFAEFAVRRRRSLSSG